MAKLDGMTLFGNSARSAGTDEVLGSSRLFSPAVWLKSPERSSGVGTTTKSLCARRTFHVSMLPKKNALFLMIGPPNVPPH